MLSPSFSQRLSDRFDGMIRLADVELLNAAVERLNGWYLFEPGADLPTSTVDGQMASQHLAALVAEILREERGVWSTMIYVQSQEDPWLIKVYHPRRAGCGCGGGGGIRPWWVLTRVPPEPVPGWSDGSVCATDAPTKAPWWKKLL
ncbi:MAG: hypothetical protein HQL63_03825 [Magnetococcales bacterium]|nr:hypothetical protein [Magnetococcales bacterium]MBF0323024.1 hypothetical protein [Magnetococcales bacterium]